MKKNRTISVDNELWEKAQELGLNMSAECETAIRIKTQATVKDAPKDNVVLKCSFCKSIVPYGYLCRERNMLMCPTCHKGWDCRVPLDHEHIRIPAYNKDIDKETNIRDDFIPKVAENGLKEQNKVSER